MPREATVERDVMEAILELSDAKSEIQDPLEVLSKKMGKRKNVVGMYIRTFESRGLITVIKSEGRGNPIVKIRILKRELPAPPTPKAKPTQATDASPIRLERRKTTREEPTPEKKVFVIVDFDNVIGAGRDFGFEISFSKLREYLRELGRVIFAEVVLSPKSNRRENIERLSAAQFEIFLSPQRFKDKDDVDAVIKAHAIRMANHSTATTIVVVSDDRDFSGDPRFISEIADLGKTFVSLRPSDHIGKISGGDEGIKTDNFSRRARELQKLVEECLEKGLDPISPNEHELVDFIRAVIRKIDQITGKIDAASSRKSFKQLQTAVWEGMDPEWKRGTFRSSDVGDIMSALQARSILNSRHAERLTYYRLDPNHAVVQQAT